MDHLLLQSVALPLALAALLAALIRLLAGARFGPALAAGAGGLGFATAAAALVGWGWPPAGGVAMLPWVTSGAVAVGLALDAVHAGRRASAVVAAVLLVSWAVLLVDDVAAAPVATVLWWLGGAVVVGLLLAAVPGRAGAVAGTVVASLGLALLALRSGSLLLFQLGLAHAAAYAAVALGQWPRPWLRFGAAAVLSAGLSWLVLAAALTRLTPAPWQAAAVVALAFAPSAVLPYLRRVPWAARRDLVEPLVAGALGALAVALALAWPLPAPGASDDPYYTPGGSAPEAPRRP